MYVGDLDSIPCDDLACLNAQNDNDDMWNRILIISVFLFNEAANCNSFALKQGKKHVFNAKLKCFKC